jgi:hypothetical protein
MFDDGLNGHFQPALRGSTEGTRVPLRAVGHPKSQEEGTPGLEPLPWSPRSPARPGREPGGWWPQDPGDSSDPWAWAQGTGPPGVFYMFLPGAGWPPTKILPISASQVAGIAAVHHHTWLVD